MHCPSDSELLCRKDNLVQTHYFQEVGTPMFLFFYNFTWSYSTNQSMSWTALSAVRNRAQLDSALSLTALWVQLFPTLSRTALRQEKNADIFANLQTLAKLSGDQMELPKQKISWHCDTGIFWIQQEICYISISALGCSEAGACHYSFFHAHSWNLLSILRHSFFSYCNASKEWIIIFRFFETFFKINIFIQFIFTKCTVTWFIAKKLANLFFLW